MADLKQIGMILVLIDGILTILGAVLGLIGAGLGIPTGVGLLGGLGIIGTIVSLVVGIVFVMLYLGKLSIGEAMMTGIVVLVLAIVAGGFLGIVGGILLIVDANSS